MSYVQARKVQLNIPWDSDFVMNRTLVYGTLITILALVYFGSAVLLQQFFYALTGQSSLLTVVASTLVIALLFQPLRYRIKVVIDRRFYHHKVDAARALAAFSARLQQNEEVNVSTIADDILDIVEKTIQPAHVSFWPCPPVEVVYDAQSIAPTIIPTTTPIITPSITPVQVQPGAPSHQLSILQTQWLPRARLAWLSLAVLTLVLFIMTIPFHAAHLHIVCAD